MKSIRLIVLFIIACSAGMAQDSLPDSLYVRRHYTKQEYRIPMRDGARLFTAVYLPKDISERHPILLTRTPYSVKPYGEDQFPAVFPAQDRHYMEEGYILVRQDVRGRYLSEGTFQDVRPHTPAKQGPRDIDESSDTYDTVEWLVKNLPHNNGRVGIKGISYPGFYTSMGSIDAHPAVKATSPQAPVSKWMAGDDFYHNGAFLISHAFDFYAKFGWPRPEPTPNDSRPFNHGRADGYGFYLDLGPVSQANTRHLRDSVAFWNELVRHGSWDSFWAERNILPHLKDIKPATMVVGGWFDMENLYGALHSYQAIEKQNKGNENMLVMGPWYHGQWSGDDGDSLGFIHWGSKTSRFYTEQLEVPFFNYHLKGKGAAPRAEAAVFLTGSNEWKLLESWPPKNVETRQLFLHDAGKLAFTPPSSPRSTDDEYVNDPDKPVPYTAELTHWYNPGFPVEDQRFAGRRPDVVTYTSEVLREDITIAGPLAASLFVSTSGTDCDWIVKVIDVFPDTTSTPLYYPAWVKLGGYQMLVRGDVLRGKFRNSLARPEPFKPEVVTKVEFELQDAFHTFKKGHRIMVQIQSSWFPMIDRNPGKFMDIYQAHESDFQKTTQRIFRSSDYPSHIRVSVLK